MRLKTTSIFHRSAIVDLRNGTSRRNEFAVVYKACRNTFIDPGIYWQYVLDPLYVTARNAAEDDDLVTITHYSFG